MACERGWSITSRNAKESFRRYDARPAREPSYPSQTPSVGDYISYDGHENSCYAEDEGYLTDIEILYAPPGFVHSADIGMRNTDF